MTEDCKSEFGGTYEQTRIGLELIADWGQVEDWSDWMSPDGKESDV